MKTNLVLALFLTLPFLQVTVTAGDSQVGIGGQLITNKCDEHLEARIILAPTTNAPVGASGIAELEVENEDGVQESSLEVKVRGLAVGDYLLSVVTQSESGTNVLVKTNVLGRFTVRSGEDDDDEDCDEDHDEDRSL